MVSCSSESEPVKSESSEEPVVNLPQTAEEKAVEEKPGGVVTGKAIIELRNGVVRELAGLELVLVPDEAAREITKLRDERWRMRASRFNFNDGYNNLDLEAIGGLAVQRSVAFTRADANGVYRFRGVPPGKYRLYAQYRSMYAVGYWLLPVEIKGESDVVEMDLKNENFAEVFNYQQRPWQK